MAAIDDDGMAAPTGMEVQLLRRCTLLLTLCNGLLLLVFLVSRHALTIAFPEVAGAQECSTPRDRDGALITVSSFHKSGVALRRRHAVVDCRRGCASP